MTLTTRILTLIAVAAAAVLPSTAAAKPFQAPVRADDQPPACAKQTSRKTPGYYCPSGHRRHTAGAATIQVATPPVADADGFSWEDASTGAGAMLAVVALGSGGLLLVRRRHVHAGTPRSVG